MSDKPKLTNEVTDDIIQRIGHLTRMMRVSMQELGLNREIEKAAQAIPDARDRLVYVAAMTEQAAHRALSAIDKASPLQDSLSKDAKTLSGQWDALYQRGGMDDRLIELVSKTQAYLTEVPVKTSETQKQLMEITMAQDFQDLTGQVIKKMMDVIKEIEHQLVQVLLESVPDGSEATVLNRLAESEWEDKKDSDSLMNGPQIKPTEGDVVTNQDQVDSLLDQLGF